MRRASRSRKNSICGADAVRRLGRINAGAGRPGPAIRPSPPGRAVKAVNSGPAAALWLLDIGGVDEVAVDSFAARLGASEAARYARFVRPLRRRQFLLGRMLLRHAVGALLGVPAATVGAVEQPGRAPRLLLADAARAVPFFSLSHSGNWAACAVGVDTPLGLDIEVMDAARDVMALAGAAFGASQGDWLASLPEAARAPAFYRARRRSASACRTRRCPSCRAAARRCRPRRRRCCLRRPRWHSRRLLESGHSNEIGTAPGNL